MNTVHFAVTASRLKGSGDNGAPVKIKILLFNPKQDVAHLWQQRVKDLFFGFGFWGGFLLQLWLNLMCFGFSYSWPSPDCHANNSLQYNRHWGVHSYTAAVINAFEVDKVVSSWDPELGCTDRILTVRHKSPDWHLLKENCCIIMLWRDKAQICSI